MLYDNGLIMEFLANLWANGVEISEIKRACEGIKDWLKREMTSEKGYFYAAQDADNFADIHHIEPEEGEFYVWSYQQLKEILSAEEFNAFIDTFIISEDGNFESKNVLQKEKISPLMK